MQEEKQSACIATRRSSRAKVVLGRRRGMRNRNNEQQAAWPPILHFAVKCRRSRPLIKQQHGRRKHALVHLDKAEISPVTAHLSYLCMGVSDGGRSKLRASECFLLTLSSESDGSRGRNGLVQHEKRRIGQLSFSHGGRLMRVGGSVGGLNATAARKSRRKKKKGEMKCRAVDADATSDADAADRRPGIPTSYRCVRSKRF